mmetsp:Transcript_20685/g.27917  ORF Transcript_20685/g.27917 Transcript_20685/m.27917 type:complete len:119 (+) Transcript_20685:572-928(+)
MISPASSVRSSHGNPYVLGSLNREREADDEVDEEMDEEEAVGRAADRMFNDRMVDNQDPQAQPVQVQEEREYLFGQVRIRQNNNVDVCCMHNLSKGFIYMFIFVTVILICLILYSACV